MHEIATVLDKNAPNAAPFVMGNTVSYADFLIMSMVETAADVMPEEE